MAASGVCIRVKVAYTRVHGQTEKCRDRESTPVHVAVRATAWLSVSPSTVLPCKYPFASIQPHKYYTVQCKSRLTRVLVDVYFFRCLYGQLSREGTRPVARRKQIHASVVDLSADCIEGPCRPRLARHP